MTDLLLIGAGENVCASCTATAGAVGAAAAHVWLMVCCSPVPSYDEDEDELAAVGDQQQQVC